jgi:hypothetical protein
MLHLVVRDRDAGEARNAPDGGIIDGHRDSGGAKCCGGPVQPIADALLPLQPVATPVATGRAAAAVAKTLLRR